MIAAGQVGIPDMMKLDVQGFELEVLKGARQALGITEVIFMEVSLLKLMGPRLPILHDIVAFMHAAGYVVFDIVGFYRRRRDHAQTDMVFCRENSPLRRQEPLRNDFDWDWGNYLDKT